MVWAKTWKLESIFEKLCSAISQDCRVYEELGSSKANMGLEWGIMEGLDYRLDS